MASSDSPIDKPQRGRPKRAELPDVNINTGVTPMLHDIELIRLTFFFFFFVFQVYYERLWASIKGRCY